MSRERATRSWLSARALRIVAPTLAAVAVGGSLAVGATGDADRVSVQAADTPGDIFLKLDGVTGGSTANGHAGEIDVESYSWGVTNTATPGLGVGGGTGSGKAQFQSFSFVKRYDRSSPVLWSLVATGKHVSTATVTVLAAGSQGPRPFMTYKFTDVILNGYQHSGAGTGAAHVSFAYRKVETIHAPTGARRSWDIRSNTAG
jgi:type VI secretion system secreted protein Hcp